MTAPDFTLSPAGWLPQAEGSAYMHWWQEVESRAAEQDDGMGQVALPWRMVPFHRPAPGALARPGPGPGRARRVPMWPEAIGPQANAPGPAFGDPMPRAGARPAALLVVIDTAINPVHARFLDDTGAPRLLAHWQMEAAFVAGSARVRFGRENRRAEMQAALALRSEDERLAALGAQATDRPHAARGTAEIAAHGTHVLDLAAGTDPLDRSAPARGLRGVPVLAVSLPSNRLLSASGAFLGVFVDQALAWVEERLANLYGQDLPPVVVNLSYGLAAGPKDGSGAMAQRLAGFLARVPGARLCMPAGNDGAAQGHGQLTAGGEPLGLVVLPGDNYSVFVEIWLPAGAPAGVALRIAGPAGEGAVIALDGPAPAAVDLGRGGRLAARLYRLDPADHAGRRGALLCIAPSDAAPASPAEAPAGLWALDLAGTPLPAGMAAEVHIQSERPLRQNSRNSHPSRLAPARAEGTISDPAAGSGAVIVAGYRASDGTPLDWSAQGWPAVPALGPHLAAPAERSAMRRDVMAAGYRSGAVAQVAGTSFASALAARDLLGHLLAGGAAADWPPAPAPDPVPADQQHRLGRQRLPAALAFAAQTGGEG